ncbi:MAG TPA: type II toxin-antitoxin system RelE/ParE family toxin [Bacteroidales bacterium]|nr:type II toxin-antitoxin system RelE/ParE family toxin [Bacteroidales bacterium]
MRLKISKSFRDKLNDQVDFISRDKPTAAIRFKNDLMSISRELPQKPFSNQKSIYFDREDIRDLIYKGYVIAYKINKDKNIIEVFGFTKHEEKPFG